MTRRGTVTEEPAGSTEAGWVPLRIVDVNELESTANRGYGKILYRNKLGARLTYNHWPPEGTPTPGSGGFPVGASSWDAGNNYYSGPSYHTFHEWAYFLEGDFYTYEYIHPNQQHGEVVRFRPGTWMDRPAFSIHDHHNGYRPGSRYRQGGCTFLVGEEGELGVETVAFDPRSPMYKPEWKAVRQFPHPRIVHTEEFLGWEPDLELLGTSVKWLSEDQVKGFRGKLRYAPAGWSNPKGPMRSYYRTAHRFFYIVYGDMNVWTYANPADSGTKIAVKKDFFIDQAPMSIWSYGNGPLTEKGCIWLEVTYAQGPPAGMSSIENPIALK